MQESQKLVSYILKVRNSRKKTICRTEQKPGDEYDETKLT